jgi:glycosyltransferase involved in cell wall biosynthesis
MGGQQSMTALIQNIDRTKYKPYVVVPSEGELKDVLEKMGVKVFIIPLISLKPKYLFKQISNIIKFRQIIKEFKIDILHPDHERDSIIAGISKLFTQTKMIWHVRLTRSVETDSLSCKLSDGIIGISHDIKQRFQTYSKIEKKYTTIYNGVDCDLFKPIISKIELRKMLGLDLNTFIICFIGQFKTGKGVIDIINAINIIKDKNLDIKFKLLMVGSPIESNTYETMKKLRNEYNLQDLIDFLPQQREIYKIMQASNLLLLPSHEGTEGMGRVIFEAMACGIPVVATNVRGVREAVTQTTGILINEKSPVELADAIIQFLTDEDLCERFAIEGRKRALSVFDIKLHAKNVQIFYDKITGKL